MSTIGKSLMVDPCRSLLHGETKMKIKFFPQAVLNFNFLRCLTTHNLQHRRDRTGLFPQSLTRYERRRCRGRCMCLKSLLRRTYLEARLSLKAFFLHWRRNWVFFRFSSFYWQPEKKNYKLKHVQERFLTWKTGGHTSRVSNLENIRRKWQEI